MQQHARRAASALVVLVVLLCCSSGDAFPSRRDRIPNSRNVPAAGGGMCEKIGHTTCTGSSGGGNPFGRYFADNGDTWNAAICLNDSDGDGRTNGDELGDSCCVWRAGSASVRFTSDISHPGFPAETTSRPSCVFDTPAAVTALAVTASASTSLAISWTPPAAATSCWCAFKVTVREGMAGEETVVHEALAYSATSANVPNLRSSTAYTVTVRPTSLNSMGGVADGPAATVTGTTAAFACADCAAGQSTCTAGDTQCTCNAGYWGALCDGECPGGVANVCAGRGTCDAATGACTCTTAGFDAASGCAQCESGLFGDACDRTCATPPCTGDNVFQPEGTSLQVSWTLDVVRERVLFTVSAATSGWVALGVSRSAGMANTDAMVVWVDDTSGVGTLVHGRIGGSRARPTPFAAQDEVVLLNASQENGITRAELVRPFRAGEVTLSADAATYSDFHLVWAVGSSDGQPLPDFSIAQHTRSAGSRGAAVVNLVTGDASEVHFTDYAKAHGVLMYLAWGVCVWVAVYMARYQKHIGHAWYHAHAGLMALAVIFMIVGLALGVHSVEESGTSHFDDPHHFIGLITLLLGVANPLVGLWANKLYEPDRVEPPVWPDRVHWWLGRGAMAFSVAAIFLGFDLYNVSTAIWVMYAVWLAFCAGVFVRKELLAWNERRASEEADEEDEEAAHIASRGRGKRMSVFKHKDMPTSEGDLVTPPLSRNPSMTIEEKITSSHRSSSIAVESYPVGSPIEVFMEEDNKWYAAVCVETDEDWVQANIAGVDTGDEDPWFPIKRVRANLNVAPSAAQAIAPHMLSEEERSFSIVWEEEGSNNSLLGGKKSSLERMGRRVSSESLVSKNSAGSLAGPKSSAGSLTGPKGSANSLVAASSSGNLDAVAEEAEEDAQNDDDDASDGGAADDDASHGGAANNDAQNDEPLDT